MKKLLKTQHLENEDHGIWSHHFMANRWGNSGNSERLYFGGASKSLQMVTAAMKLKETISKVKRQLSEWEKIIPNEVTDKQTISKIYKQLLQLNSRKINDPIKKWAKELNSSPKKTYK